MTARRGGVARELFEAVLAKRTPLVAVVGGAKNAGKTVTAAALCAQAQLAGLRLGVCTIGRDGEAFDVLAGNPKPKLRLAAGATIATVAAFAARSPALEILEDTGESGALGRVAIARVRAGGDYEIAGPASAAALRRVTASLRARSDLVVVDGAVDRLSAAAAEGCAIVVAAGAIAPDFETSVAAAAGLVAHLRLPAADAARESVVVEGALDADLAAALLRAGERRQIVVQDPLHVVVPALAFGAWARRLDVRCRRTLQVVACTVAPMHPERTFEPRTFLRAIAERTGLPSYDLFANEAA